MASVGDRIKNRRIELGWTQDVLAQKAGISKGFLSDLENGKRSIGAGKLLDLAQVLGKSLDFLMKGEDVEGTNFSRQPEVQVPRALADFASNQGLSFKKTVALLSMQQQIIAHRSSTRQEGADKVDWQKFYEAVKDFL